MAFGTMTCAGLDVHARSTHAAAIDTATGDRRVTRVRFGSGVEEPIVWLQSLPGPVRACYEAGPTGFGLYRRAVAAGVSTEAIAPGKMPRARPRGASTLARCEGSRARRRSSMADERSWRRRRTPGAGRPPASGATTPRRAALPSRT